MPFGNRALVIGFGFHLSEKPVCERASSGHLSSVIPTRRADRRRHGSGGWHEEILPGRAPASWGAFLGASLRADGTRDPLPSDWMDVGPATDMIPDRRYKVHRRHTRRTGMRNRP